MSDDSRLWTTDDVARYLNVSRKTVYRLPGLIPVYIEASGKDRKMMRFLPSDVRKWAENRRAVKAS